MSNKKDALFAARAVSQALRKSLEEIKANVKYSPQEAATKINQELRKHIVDVRDYLVELQKREGNLNKAVVQHSVTALHGHGDANPKSKDQKKFLGMSPSGSAVRAGDTQSAKFTLASRS